MSVPAEAYELYAAGEISAQELQDLEKLASYLEKSAAVNIDPATVAALGGLAAAAPTLAYMGSSVPSAMQGAANKIRFESGLRRAVETNPSLGSTNDPNLRMAYKTLQTTNPEYAKDPLIAGTILDMVMANRMDPSDPSSAPRFDPALLSEIQKNTSRPADTSSALLSTMGRTILEKSAAVNIDPATIAALGGLAAAAPTLAYMGSSVPAAMQGAANRIRFESGLRRAVEVNPSLGSTEDPHLRMAYKTLQTTNPDYAKDPLIAGTILDMVMANRMDPSDPSSAPRFDPALLSQVQQNISRPDDISSTLLSTMGQAILE